ncbi:MAG: hypothetical protein IPJ90_05730 [Anaerolineaceae bacterium]|nr:hypothetical protein [Anaerolineaceae bacterium]
MIPLALLALFALVPAADPTIQAPVFHFYIVTFFTFAAVVAAYLWAWCWGRAARRATACWPPPLW